MSDNRLAVNLPGLALKILSSLPLVALALGKNTPNIMISISWALS